jgi:protein involved in polysaccharide export with SLBB domain
LVAGKAWLLAEGPGQRNRAHLNGRDKDSSTVRLHHDAMTPSSAFRAVFTALCLAISLCASANAQDALPLRASYGAEMSYHLGTGDKIRVIVYGEDDLSGEFQVDENGDISVPMIGQIRASGLTGPQLEASIQTALADGYLNDPHVSVQVTQYRPFYIIGQVNRPGQYPYVTGMTALNAVALAGGYTDHAEDSDIYVRRYGENRERELPANATTRIYPGDVVRVPESTFWTVMSALDPIASTAAPFAYATHF